MAVILKMKRFGLPYNPGKEKRIKNKITKHIVVFLCLFIVIVAIATVGFAMIIRNYISCLYLTTLEISLSALQKLSYMAFARAGSRNLLCRLL